MKVSFLRDSSSGPVLMLSGCVLAELLALRDAARDLGEGVRDWAIVDADRESDAALLLRVAERDIGILNTPPGCERQLRRSRWTNTEGLIEPFRSGSSGFQWLDDGGEVALLLAPEGKW